MVNMNDKTDPGNPSLDSSCRFIFNGADVRGNLVRLGDSYHNMTRLHDYDPVARKLLGEFLVAALLLSDTIKFSGRLVLQATSQGPVRLVMAEATHDGKTRGIVRMEDDESPLAADASIDQLLADGVIAVTVEPDQGQRYQSIVPLSGHNLAACLENYFRQSEQLSTYVHLAVARDQAAGILVQQLPIQVQLDQQVRDDQWQTVRTLATTVTDTELLEDSNEVIVRHLFAEADVRILGENPVAFACSCSEERMAEALVSLGGAQLDELFSETEELELTCEYCAMRYLFSPDHLTRWVTGDAPKH